MPPTIQPKVLDWWHKNFTLYNNTNNSSNPVWARDVKARDRDETEMLASPAEARR